MHPNSPDKHEREHQPSDVERLVLGRKDEVTEAADTVLRFVPSVRLGYEQDEYRKLKESEHNSESQHADVLQAEQPKEMNSRFDPRDPRINELRKFIDGQASRTIEPNPDLINGGALGA